MDCTQNAQLSIYDIGRINFQIKKMLLGANVLSMVLSGDIVDNGSFTSASSVILTTNSPSTISSVKFLVTSTLVSTIMSMQNDVMSMLLSLGYTDPNTFYNAILNRVDMLYTVLQISEQEFSVILI